MTIDERLEALLQSSKSLHARCQELHARQRAQIEENRRRDERVTNPAAREARRALLARIATLLQALDDREEGENGTLSRLGRRLSS